LTSYIFGGSFDKIFTVTNLLRGKAYYQSKPLHHLLKELSGGKHYRLIDITSQTDTRVVIVSVDHSKSPALPYLFRSYNPPTAASRYHGTCQTPLWQALRASTAAPGYFDDLPLDDRRFVDGGIAFNNPAALALHEARALWPNRPLGVLLSIGNGNPRPRKTEHSFTQTLLTVVHACTETEKTHQMLLDLLSPDAYFRLNPEDDSFEWSLDETRPEKFDSLDAAVDAFAEQNSELLQQICDKLSSM
jgi:calcium-independent phospholipase A2-gamma